MIKVFFSCLLIAFIAFANGLSGPFMLDDHAFFTAEVKDIRYLPQHFVPKTYKTSVQGVVPHGQPSFYFRPFAKILPSVSYAMFGEKTFFYHLLNLTLLVTAGFLLFRFLLVTGALGRRGAFLAGLFYVIHPVNGVMVNYITASVFSAQVIFMILSLLLLQGRQCPGAPGTQEKDNWGSGTLGLWGALSFFFLALLCHETAVLLPLYALILDYSKTPTGASLPRMFDSFKRVWFLWAVAAGWLIFRFFYASLGEGLIAKFARFEMNPVEYAASVTKLSAWYLSKLIVPWDIVLIWATPVVRGSEATSWLLIGFLMLGLWGFVYTRTKDKIIRLGLLWLATGFLPLPLMCLFQPTHGPMIEPHWFVFSVIGFFVCAARQLEGLKPDTLKSVVAAVLAVMVVTGWRHNYLWADEKRYAHYWSEVSPSIKAVWFHLGEIYFRERRFSQAAGYYERSIRKTYQDYLAYQRMGLAYFNVQDFRRAQVNFILSLGLEPRQPGVRERLKWIEQNVR